MEEEDRERIRERCWTREKTLAISPSMVVKMLGGNCVARLGGRVLDVINGGSGPVCLGVLKRGSERRAEALHRSTLFWRLV